MTCPLRIYNTLTRRTDPFRPLTPGEAKIYTCGPTVYNYAHIGNFRSYVFADILRTALAFSGLKVVQVMNITDVDDKTITGSRKENLPLGDFTARYTRAFFEDLDALKIARPEYSPAATDHIPEMIDIIRTLEKKGYTYLSDGSVYFSVEKFAPYGKLSGMKLDQNKDGARVDADEYEKSSAKDFVLWKARKEGEPFWETLYGPGRPGWHIECSAMSMKYLGPSFDLHTGGADLVFPHHENEIAQSEAATGKPFVGTWVHCAYLIVNGEKMSKSRGNFFTLRDILDKGYSPAAVRLVLLSTHYRKNLDFTFEGLKQAEQTVQKISLFRSGLDQAPEDPGSDSGTEDILRSCGERFRTAICDDLNVSGALAAVFDLMSAYNRKYHNKPVPAGVRLAARDSFAVFDEILKLPAAPVVPAVDAVEEAAIREAVAERQSARQRKDFAAADRIRDALLQKGIILEDTKDGIKWRKSVG